MLSLNPWVWLGGLALLVGTGATFYLRGAADERNDIALERAAVIVKREKTIRTINASDTQLAAAHEAGKQAAQAKLQEDIDALTKMLEGAGDCRLPDDALRLLNRARGAAVSTAPGGPDGTVPGSGVDQERQPIRPGAPEPEGRGPVRDVRGPPEEAAIGREAARAFRQPL